MKQQWIWATTLSAAVVLTGCVSGQKNVQYYTLSPAVAMDSAQQSNPWMQPYRVSVTGLSGQMDETPLVVRQSDDRLMILAFDRWSSPLQEQVQQSLAQALTNELGMPPVQSMPMGMQQQPIQVNVQIQGFELEPGQRAILDAVWQVSFDKPAQRLICHSVNSHPSEPGVAPLVRAQQDNVRLLAHQIAQVLQTKKPLGGLRCTTR